MFCEGMQIFCKLFHDFYKRAVITKYAVNASQCDQILKDENKLMFVK